nr:MAG TPA: hypothetical protein [Caudoviricetes sp.]
MRCGAGRTHWTVQASSSTHHRHSITHTDRTDTIHRLTSHCSHSHNQPTNNQ